MFGFRKRREERARLAEESRLRAETEFKKEHSFWRKLFRSGTMKVVDGAATAVVAATIANPKFRKRFAKTFLDGLKSIKKLKF